MTRRIANTIDLHSSPMEPMLRRLFAETQQEKPDRELQHRLVTEMLMAAMIGMSTFYTEADADVSFDDILRFASEWFQRREAQADENIPEVPDDQGIDASNLYISTFFQLVLGGMNTKATFQNHSRASLSVNHYGNNEQGMLIGTMMIGTGQAMDFLKERVDLETGVQGGGVTDLPKELKSALLDAVASLLTGIIPATNDVVEIAENASTEDATWLTSLDFESIRERGDTEEIDAILARAASFLPESKVAAIREHLRDECDCTTCSARRHQKAMREQAEKN